MPQEPLEGAWRMWLWKMMPELLSLDWSLYSSAVKFHQICRIACHTV